MALHEGRLKARDESGKELCTIHIVCLNSSYVAPIHQIDVNEARAFGEECFQLLEGTEYEYELDSPYFELENTNGYVKKSGLSSESGLDRGRIITGNRTGRLRLTVRKNDATAGYAYVEVRSSKIDYRSDYRRMLSDISELSVDLILSVSGSTDTRLGLVDTIDLQSLQQRFFLIKGIVDSDDFHNALSLILRRPFSRLISSIEPRRLTRGAKISQVARSQLVRGTPRVPVPPSHPIAQKIGKQFTLPEFVDVSVHEDSLDIPENRFVKFILEEFLEFLLTCKNHFREVPALETVAHREIEPSIDRLQEYLSNSVLKNLSQLSYVPVASPVMQNRAGYREILRLWVKSKQSFDLEWSALSDLFYGGSRDIATLYEYWVFFKLWRSFCDVADISLSDMADQVLKIGARGFSIKIKTGALFKASSRTVEVNGNKINMQFSYNRRFIAPKTTVSTRRLDYESSYPGRGSWTRVMQPDYTVSFWPSGYSAKDAEYAGKMCHVHFDAKYRLNKISDAFGLAGNPDADDSLEGSARDDYKRIDLLKMHSYKDSIRCSRGAYIIYPGRLDERLSYRLWTVENDAVPGIGAFCLRPGEAREGAPDALAEFLRDVLDHLSLDSSFN